MLMPDTIKEAKRAISKGEGISKNIALELQEFFDQNVQFELPVLKESPEYKKNI